MKDLQRETIMSNVSFGSVYGNNYDLSGYASSPRAATTPSSGSGGGSGGSLLDHFGYGWDVLNGDLDDGYNGFGIGPDDVSNVCGSCHSTFNGNHSGNNSSNAAGNNTGYSPDIGGESGYGGIGL